MITTIYNVDRTILDEKAAKIIASTITNLLHTQDQIVFAIPGGRSVVGIFNLLKEMDDIPWDKVHIFLIDERLVPLDHKDSNFRQAKTLWLDELYNNTMLPKENLHPFRMKDTEDHGVSEYVKELEKRGGKYDIVLLGTGEDGHIGALYPDHHSITNEEPYFLTMDDSPKPPAERMTMSKNLLLQSQVGILLFYGDNKADAYRAFVNPSLSTTECPAKLVKKLPETYVLTTTD